MGVDAGADDAADASGADTPLTVKIGDADVEVSKEVADHIKALEDNAPAIADWKAPEGDYAINLSEDLIKAGFEAKTDDPMFKLASEWCKKYDVPQSAFDELAAGYFGHQQTELQTDAEDQAKERTKMLDHFSDGGKITEGEATKKAQAVANWAVKTLGESVIKDPELADELKFLTATADGIRLLDALRQRTGGPSAPGHRDNANSAASDPLEATYPSMKNLN